MSLKQRLSQLVLAIGIVSAVLLLVAGCGLTATSTSPPCELTLKVDNEEVGPDPVELSVGQIVAIEATSNRKRDVVEWLVTGVPPGVVSEGRLAVIYTAPDGAGKNIVTVQATATDGVFCGTASVTFDIIPPTPTPIPPGPVLIKPTGDTVLISDGSIVDCPISGAQGEIRAQGLLNLSGLAPGQLYHLTLNGKRGIPPNEELCKTNCTPTGEGYWDFMSVTTDSAGTVSNEELVGLLPPGVELFSGETYNVKFFVKDVSYCTVLGNNDFLFTVESRQ